MRSASSPHTKQKALKSADFKAFGAAGQIRTATAHSACALYVVMPIPLGFASLKKVGSSNTDNTRKTPQALRACGAFLELLGRFELPQRIALTRYTLLCLFRELRSLKEVGSSNVKRL